MASSCKPRKQHFGNTGMKSHEQRLTSETIISPKKVSQLITSLIFSSTTHSRTALFDERLGRKPSITAREDKTSDNEGKYSTKPAFPVASKEKKIKDAEQKIGFYSSETADSRRIAKGSMPSDGEAAGDERNLRDDCERGGNERACRCTCNSPIG
ncbi:hypothetical protein CRG98_005628 [Punica granatum]|uniref:Uncharacterized protein n=1 Tax=Punica granatum TaxID=22663 RepID=A0A2I0KZX1_PUNGR|nr:hypothetical protein CRG98_005628 [Punica granatum]